MASREELDAARPVVAFRTHIWSEEVARLARRLRHFSPGAAFTLLMDETNGVLPAENFTKLSHTADFSALGLPAHPAKDMLWFNADYPLYLLRRAYPQASHFAMVEYDVAVNTDIMPMLQRARDEAIDLIVSDIGPSAPPWFWHDSIKQHYAAPLRAFLPFMVISARAIDVLYQERRRIAAQWAISPASPMEDWPYGEAFIPSAVAQLENASIRALREFVKLPVFTFRPAQHIDDPAMNLPGTICHPVVGGEGFLNRRVARAGFEELFDPRSNLLTQLSFCDPAAFAKILFENVKKDRDILRLKMFMALAEAKRWPVAMRFDNLALFKPALMSSAWRAGTAADLATLAGGGNNGVIDGGFGFHTDLEAEPWWQVDLESNVALTHVIVFNRLDQAARCRRLRVSGSLDGRSWQSLAEKNDDILFGGADGHPLVFEMRRNPVVRYVRLTNLERNYFHLDEVQILGRAAA
jgi:hypothetical protein